MATPPTFTAGQILTAAQMNTVGLWLIKTQTIGSGVTSVPVTSVFSADYDAYRIIINVASSNGANSATIQLNNDTGNNYYQNGLSMTWTSTSQVAYGPAASSSWLIMNNNAASTSSFAQIDLFNPFLSVRTFMTHQGIANTGDILTNGTIQTTNSNTGFTITKSGDTMTGGSIRVYGYRN